MKILVKISFSPLLPQPSLLRWGLALQSRLALNLWLSSCLDLSECWVYRHRLPHLAWDRISSFVCLFLSKKKLQFHLFLYLLIRVFVCLFMPWCTRGGSEDSFGSCFSSAIEWVWEGFELSLSGLAARAVAHWTTLPALEMSFLWKMSGWSWWGCPRVKI